MSYQHCPSQKPAAAGMSVQVTPSGEDLMVPVLLEAQFAGTSSKTAKNVVVGVAPVERLTANLVTGVAGPPLMVKVLPVLISVCVQVGVAAQALLLTPIPPSFAAVVPITLTRTRFKFAGSGSMTMSVTFSFPCTIWMVSLAKVGAIGLAVNTLLEA